MDSFFRILLEDGDDILLESDAYLLLETAPSLVTAAITGSAEGYGDFTVAQLLAGTLDASAEAYGDMAVAQLLTGTMTLAGEASADNWQMSYQVVSVRGVAYDYSEPYANVVDESQGYP